MFNKVMPKKQRHQPSTRDPYVRLTTRLFYLSSEAMKMLGETQSIGISINPQQRVMILSPGGEWRLTSVCETQYARRIENGSSLISFLQAGFPKGMLGKYLRVQKDMSGSLVVSLIPEYEAAS